MKRRDLTKGAGAGLLAGAFTPAHAADLPAIRWRMASSFPKSLDTIYGAGEVLARRLDQITQGRLQLRVFAGGFRKEIKSLADLKGVKMRIPGIGGEIMAQLGVVPQTLAGGDIYPALERGALDATEWVGPYDDEKLGFHKGAKHYYYPRGRSGE